jgi:cobalt-zinc-cadmium efflux system protein
MGAHSHHDHSDHEHGGHAHGNLRATPRRALTLALALTAGFMGVEAVVGWWSGSLALLADAGHMLSDSGSLLLALVVAAVAERPRSARKTYGYQRAEVLGALLNAIALLGVAAWIVVEAVHRLDSPPAVHGTGMMVAAFLGLLVNLSVAAILARQGGGNINVRAALLHVLGDTLGSVAALTAGGLILGLGWTLADPIASLLIAALVTAGSARLLLEATHVLMEGTPKGLDVDAVEATIVASPGVGSVHDLHVWCLTPGEPMLTAHVVLEQGHHGTDVARHVGERLRDQHGIEHVTIQPEPPPPEAAIVPVRRLRKPSLADA